MSGTPVPATSQYGGMGDGGLWVHVLHSDVVEASLGTHRSAPLEGWVSTRSEDGQVLSPWREFCRSAAPPLYL